MQRNRIIRSGSPVAFCLILLLSIAFPAPLYHNHDHSGDYHQENHDGHVLLHDSSEHEGLSADEQHDSAHLHLKKDIGRTDTRPHIKGISPDPLLCAVITASFLSESLSFSRLQREQPAACRSTLYDWVSGLSPPVS